MGTGGHRRRMGFGPVLGLVGFRYVPECRLSANRQSFVCEKVSTLISNRLGLDTSMTGTWRIRSAILHHRPRAEKPNMSMRHRRRNLFENHVLVNLFTQACSNFLFSSGSGIRCSAVVFMSLRLSSPLLHFSIHALNLHVIAISVVQTTHNVLVRNTVGSNTEALASFH